MTRLTRFQLPVPIEQTPLLSASTATAGRVHADLATLHLTCAYVAIHAGGRGPTLDCARMFGRVAQNLGRRWRLPSLVLYEDERERGVAEAVVARSGGHALLAPRWNWRERGCVLAGSEAVLNRCPTWECWAELHGAPTVRLTGDDCTADEILRECEALLHRRPKAVALAHAA